MNNSKIENVQPELLNNSEQKDGSQQVTSEMKKFAQEYSLWVITYGQTYINALSPNFDVDNDPMDIFLSNYHGNDWVNGLVC